jgi:hypothetical protein
MALQRSLGEICFIIQALILSHPFWTFILDGPILWHMHTQNLPHGILLYFGKKFKWISI